MTTLAAATAADADPRKERLANAAAQGYEVNREGLALSGPHYYEQFHRVCLKMVREYGINQFKLDGTGSTAEVVPGSAFGSDFEAAIQLIADLRVAKPDLFINLTTGTYPSPFWLRHADSTWLGTVLPIADPQPITPALAAARKNNRLFTADDQSAESF